VIPSERHTTSLREIGALPELPRCTNELPEMAVPFPFVLRLAGIGSLLTNGEGVRESQRIGPTVAEERDLKCNCPPNSTIFFGTPTYQNGFGLSCASNQYSPLTHSLCSSTASLRVRHDRWLLGLLAASFGHLQTAAA
jgi:hypothetical protein